MEATEQIERFGEFFESYKGKIMENLRKGNSFVVVDFTELIKYDPELAEQLLEEPEEVIRASELAIEDLGLEGNLRAFRVRFKNLPQSNKLKISDIRSKHIGKLYWVEGIVRQKSDVRPLMMVVKFECPVCSNSITVPQLEKKMREPTRCGGCGKKGKFRILNKELVDTQGIVLEEHIDDLEDGEQPKRVNVFLNGDLVSPLSERRTNPGSKILVVGIIKEVPIILRTGGQSTRLDLLIEANYICPMEETFNIQITEEDEKEIIKLSKREDILRMLSDSIFTEVEGLEKIKEAITLQQFGGVSGAETQGNIHILLLGDPAMGKSHLFSKINKVALKVRRVVGAGASKVGITASVVKDEMLNRYSLEAGALVLANNGLCLIDELKDMDESDLKGLSECMSSQTVTINKANIQAILQAKTSILSAANPKFGRFDGFDGFSNFYEDLDLEPKLISRFDWIFPLRDKPDKENDEKIAKSILSRRMKDRKIEGEIPTKLIKKYLIYAKRIEPIITEDVMKFAVKRYVNIRSQSLAKTEKIISITHRYVDAMAKFSQAHGRMKLHKEVTIDDMEYAIDSIMDNLKEIAFDPSSGMIDVDKVTVGISTSTRSNIHVIIEAIDKLEATIGKMIPIEDIITETKLKEFDVEECLEKLRRMGDIFEPRTGFIQKI